MNEKEINRYLELANRRLFIILHSGVDWKPEYASELAAIDQELAGMRSVIDGMHKEREVA